MKPVTKHSRRAIDFSEHSLVQFLAETSLAQHTICAVVAVPALGYLVLFSMIAQAKGGGGISSCCLTHALATKKFDQRSMILILDRYNGMSLSASVAVLSIHVP